MTTTAPAATTSPTTGLLGARLEAAWHLARSVPVRFYVLALLAGLLVGACQVVTPWSAGRPGYDSQSAVMFGLLLSGLLALGLAVAPALALFRPLVATVLGLLPVLVTGLYGGAWPFPAFMGLTAVLMTATWTHRLRALVPGFLALALIVQLASGHAAMVVMDGSLIMFSDGQRQGVVALVGLYSAALALAYGLALWMRASALKARRLSTLTARADAVEDRATVVEERARLARDLHDVVAHHVSLIAVRAETAPYTHPGIDDDARHVLAEIAGEARSALDELRGVLGVLRRDDTAEADLAPQPDLAGVAGLVERTRAAGADVSLSGDVLAPVSAPVGYAVYRLVQEALTNARRHAPGQPVAVVVLGEGGRLRVRVTNPYLAASATPGAGGGGLVGMRERVEALEGRLTAGVDGDLFVVEADLPSGVL